MAPLTVPADVLEFIASRVQTNIRELEGALTRVVAFSSLTGRPMTVELAQEVLKDVFPQGELPEVSVERIQETVIERFGISMQELTGDRRSQQIVYPRQVAMYLCRELTDLSLPKIGQQFGGPRHECHPARCHQAGHALHQPLADCHRIAGAARRTTPNPRRWE